MGSLYSEIPAGTAVVVTAVATLADESISVSGSFIVAKRKISVIYAPGEDAAIEGRDIAEDGEYKIGGEALDGNAFTISVDGEGFALDTPAAADMIKGDASLDLSAVDLSKDSFNSKVPMSVEFTPEFFSNFDPVGNIFGDVYTTKAKYFVVLLVNNDGKQLLKTYEQDYEESKTINEYSWWDEFMDEVDGSFADSNTNTELMGWSIYSDGFNYAKFEDYERYDEDYRSWYPGTYVEADGYTYDKGEFYLKGTMDYLFVGQVVKNAAEGLKVTTIPSVYYDGRSHEAAGTKVNAKKVASDLRFVVYNSSGRRLYLGSDYTVSYKNNKNASMKLVRDNSGEATELYKPLYTSDSKRPSVTITGKGTYKGFSATVYFDILPVNLGASEYYMVSSTRTNEYYGTSDCTDPYSVWDSYAAVMTPGFGNSYLLKNGKVSGIKKPKVTKSFYSRYTYSNGSLSQPEVTSTLTLKEGVDYEAEIYKYDEESVQWIKQSVSDPTKLTAVGDYLYLIRGIGNYCGALYDNLSGESTDVEVDDNDYDEFSDGSISPINPGRHISNYYYHQFRITEDDSYDLSKAKLSISKKKIAYDGELHGVDDFGLVVRDKNGKELTINEDYYLRFSGRYRHYDSSGSSGEKVSAANYYNVYIYSMGDYYGTKSNYNVVSISGIKLSKKDFSVTSKISNYNDSAKLSLVNEKYTLTDSTSPYYVAYYSSYNDYETRFFKGYFRVGGYERTGDAIDPSVYLTYNWSRTKMSLQSAIKEGIVSFEVAETGQYIIKGTMPDSVTVSSGGASKTAINDLYDGLYNGYGLTVSTYTKDGIEIGDEVFTLSFKGNTKLGSKASVTAKGNKYFSGSAAIGKFEVIERDITDFKYISVGAVFNVVTDGQQGKASLDKPNVKLYQYYRDNKGDMRYAPLSAAQYSVKKGDDIGTNGIATETYVVKGSADGFNFAKTYKEEGLQSGNYALYKNKLSNTLPTKITIDGTETTQKKGVIDYSTEFTGTRISPYVSSVKIGDKELTNSDFNSYYGTNIAAGKNSGTLYIRAHYNSYSDTYEYGGSATFKFTITEVDGITL